MACFAARPSRLAAALRALGAAVTDSPTATTVILDGARPPTDPADLQRVRQAVAAARTVVVWNLTPEGQPALAKVLPPVAGLHLTKTDAVQLIRGDEDLRLDGVEHADLYGIGKDSAQPVMRYAVAGPAGSRRLLVTNRTDWRRWAFEGENTKPAALLRSERAPFTPQCGLLALNCDGQRVIVNQVLCSPRGAKGLRFAAQLLTNLGVAISPANARPEDLAAFNTDENGFIVAWLICGPFAASSYQGACDTDFLGGEAAERPEAGLIRGGRVWRPYLCQGPAVDFGAKDLLGELTNAAAYAATYVYAERGLTANLWLGADDGLKVWLNGQPVLSNPHVGPLEPDQFKVADVALRQGWNLLLLKVSQSWGKWAVCARLMDAHQEPLTDLRVTSTPPLRPWQELERSAWSATSQPPGDTKAAFDGDPATRWTSGRPQETGQWFALDLGAPQAFARVMLDSAGSPGDYPRGLRLEASDDGVTWREVAALPDTQGAAPGGVLDLLLPPSTTLLLPPTTTALRLPCTTTRWLRLTQTAPAGASGGLYWSIHELRLYR
jgi:hypothetical protein